MYYFLFTYYLWWGDNTHRSCFQTGADKYGATSHIWRITFKLKFIKINSKFRDSLTAAVWPPDRKMAQNIAMATATVKLQS